MYRTQFFWKSLSLAMDLIRSITLQDWGRHTIRYPGDYNHGCQGPNGNPDRGS